MRENKKKRARIEIAERIVQLNLSLPPSENKKLQIGAQFFSEIGFIFSPVIAVLLWRWRRIKKQNSGVLNH